MTNKLIRVSGCRYDNPVGKRIERAPDGSIAKTALLDERSKKAEVFNEEHASATEAFAHRRSADARTMFFTGTFAPGLTDVVMVPKGLVTEARERFGPDGGSVVAATKEYLAFREGPGLLTIDIDRKDRKELAAVYPDAEPFRFMTFEEVEQAIGEVLPEANGCPLMICASASSMIVDAVTGELVKGPGGWRVCIPVDNAREVPRILNVMHLRCWARGLFRYAFLSDGGAILDRSLADQAMGRPTQPDYPRADLGQVLKRASDADAEFDVDGPYMTAASVTISDEEREIAAANIEKARQLLAPDRKKLVSRRVREHTADLVAKGVPKDAAERSAAKRFEAGVLLGSDAIALDDGEVVSVASLLDDEDMKYDGRVCFDPVEPGYDGGRPVGMMFLNDGVRPVVVSFAHGEKVYHLRHDNETAKAAMNAAGDRAEVFNRILALSDLEPVEHSQREKQAVKALGLGNEKKSLRAGVARFRAWTADHEHEGDGEEAAQVVLYPPYEPFKVAQQYVDAHCTYKGDAAQLTLLQWRGSWWAWKASNWAELSEAALEKDLYAFTNNAVHAVPLKPPAPWMPDRHKIASLKHALQAVLLVKDEVEMPYWTDGRKTGTLVACANGLLDIRARELMPHSPLYFNVVHTPIVYDPSAMCPQFGDFERSLWPLDDETPRTLRQMLGYLVSGRTDLQSVFGLIGAKRGGKGTIAWLAAQLLGASAEPLTQADLGDKFGMEHLIGKSVAIIADTRTAGKNTQIVVERLLSISGEDAVPVHRKNKMAWRGRMTARIMWLSNEVPFMGDASMAVASRFILLMFTETFAGREDRGLKDKLSAELPGILNAALDGLADLEKEGRFTQSTAAREGVEKIVDMSSAEHTFVEELCEMRAGYRVEKLRLYKRYQQWRQERGYKVVDLSVFARNLFAAFPGQIGRARTRRGDDREQCFSGIKLLDTAYATKEEKARSRVVWMWSKRRQTLIRKRRDPWSGV
ncbi:DNA primase family protein [Mesorhizobium escarrei]|uniref:SF3 helicase domain-containing protein n=1 Tax=Mesorhizobium escarrei TaxID=666018 RepID=A0ABM9ECU6_9HYPH|nr:phage/plasmid primase, P4 family [Mesorhizobium escarrei]CAH2407073.1 hypothetical protein MES5069_550124 [Mesorhizobium escarrei]